MSELNNAEIAALKAQVLIEEEVELLAEHAAAIDLVKIEVHDPIDEETEVFSERSILYRFSEEDNDWKERARGDIKIVQSKQTGKYRAIMHQDQTLKVRLNQIIGDIQLKPNSGSDKAWTWRWQDYATETGEPEVYSFAVRFRTSEVATKFFDTWEVARVKNSAAEEQPAAEAEVVAEPAAEAEVVAEPAAEEAVAPAAEEKAE